MIIMGIDPGSRQVGVAALQIQDQKPKLLVCGVLVLEGATFHERILRLGQEMQGILQKYQPQHLALERLFLGRNPDSAFKLGHARGVILEKALNLGCQVYEYSPREIKKSVAGSGAADKVSVAQTLQMQFQFESIPSHDATDALALAAHHFWSRKLWDKKSSEFQSPTAAIVSG